MGLNFKLIGTNEKMHFGVRNWPCPTEQVHWIDFAKNVWKLHNTECVGHAELRRFMQQSDSLPSLLPGSSFFKNCYFQKFQNHRQVQGQFNEHQIAVRDYFWKTIIFKPHSTHNLLLFPIAKPGLVGWLVFLTNSSEASDLTRYVLFSLLI